MTLKEIAERIGGRLVGPEDMEISGPAKIEEARPGEITFISNPKYKHYLSTTQASAVIVDDSLKDVSIPHVVVADSYVAFVLVLRLYDKPVHGYLHGLSKKAYIDPSAKVHPTASVAPLAYIGPGAVIGSNTVIYPGVIILKDVHIGDDCIIYPNVSIREFCTIGNRVILQNGCVIGSDGFGFAPYEGRYEKIPQIGNVIIEDDVEIGANCTVDRSTLGSTVIKQGSKLDNLVQVAHNVTIGEHTVMAAQSGIAGSTTVGRHVTIGGQVGVTGHIKVGDNAVLAAQSGITKNVEDGAVLFGTPAVPLSLRKRIDVSLRKLPELVKLVHELEKEIAELKKG